MSKLKMKMQKEFFNSATQGWKEIKNGIFEKVLNQDKDGKNKTVLQKWKKGTETKEVSVHNYIEEVFILEGKLKDKFLNKSFEKGFYAYRHIGMIHGPYIAEDEVIMLIIII
jgi:hypothetical protein